MNKRETYDDCYREIVAIWSDEGGSTLDDIALMATINSVLSHHFPHFYWTGFYRVCGDRLIVGPYIGSHRFLQPCIRIHGEGSFAVYAAQRL